MFAAAATGAVCFAAWVYLAAARGRFWRVRDEPAPARPARRAVAAIIPARNEAEYIGAAVRSLHTQRYSGTLTVTVVDDNSQDATASEARAATSSLEVIEAPRLPEGWTGKMWAVHIGVRHAALQRPEFYLLTDADVVHGPTAVQDLVSRAEAGALDLASYMVLLRAESISERLLIPAFVFFFLMLYPPEWIARPASSVAGAAGGCILIRRTALDRIGGIASIRGEIIDDCALAARVKHSGGRIWMGLTRSSRSIRAYDGPGDIWRMISRTAFTQLKHSPMLLAGTVSGMALLYGAPAALVFSRNKLARILGLGSWTLMFALYAPILRFYRVPLWYAPFLPAIAVFYTGATIDSAVRYWSGSGGQWKGRI